MRARPPALAAAALAATALAATALAAAALAVTALAVQACGEAKPADPQARPADPRARPADPQARPADAHARLADAPATPSSPAADSSAGSAATQAPPQLFTEPEIAALEAALSKRLEANTRRSCARPLLRGAALPGPAAPALIAIVEPAAGTELAVCLEKIGAVAKEAGLSALVERRASELIALDKECGAALESAIGAVAAHEDACSPYQPGVRADPETFLAAIRVAHMLALRARLRAEAGDPAGALWLLIEATRAFQDLARGQTDLITAMIASAAIGVSARQLGRLLDGARLPAGAVSEVAAALDGLLASEQGFGHTLLGERDSMSLYAGLARLKPAEWVPPGGTNPSLRSLAKPGGDASLKIGPRDEGAMMIALGEQLGADLASACPETAPHAACWRGLDALTRRPPRTPTESLKDPVELMERMIAETSGVGQGEARERARLEVKRLVLGVVAEVATPRYGAYVAKRTREVVVRLVGLRLALEARRLGRCPTEAELASAPFVALRSPAVLGDAVIVTVEKDALRVEPPAWARKDDEPPSTFRCR